MRKKGFTIVELIAVILILSLLMVLVIPNVVHFSDTSRTSLKDSKIKTLESAAEQYGNDLINRFQNCTNESSLDELKNQCSIKAVDLVTGGYLTADDEDNNIVDPVSNKPMTGDILICYNPARINVYTQYIEGDEGYSCMDISVDANATLNLAKATGTSYIGADELTVGIVKTGSFVRNGFSCSSSNEEVATCTLDGTKNLKIKVTATHTDKEYEEVKITLKAQPEEGSPLTKVYTLKVYPTSLEIDKGEAYNVCMKPDEKETFSVVKENVREIEVSSSDEEILEGLYDKDRSTLVISAQGKFGRGEISLKETNGNKDVTLEKVVYRLQSAEDFPEGMLIGSTEDIRLLKDGNESVTIESSNPEVIKLFKSGVADTDKITLEGEDEFSLRAVGSGDATITITGEPCGRVTYKVIVQNIYVEDHEMELYVNGSARTTQIVSGSENTYTCTSENPTIVSCSVTGSTLTLTPGEHPSYVEGINVTVTGANGGSDTVNVVVKTTSIELVDENNNPVAKTCINKQGGANSTRVFIKGDNMGPLSISNISPSELATARVAGTEVVYEKRALSSGVNNFNSGYNTGIAHIEVNEGNSNKKVGFDYYIYDMSADTEIITLKTGKTTTIKVKASTTGVISAFMENPDVARVSISGPENFSYDVNAENEYTISVQGVIKGETNLIIRGADCGEIVIPVQVEGHSFSIKLEKGDFVDWISDGTYEITSLSCATESSETSCKVTFPEIITNPNFTKMGFSKTKRHDVLGFDEGAELTLNEENDGDVYYANVTEDNKPVCKMKDFVAGSAVGSISYVTMICVEVDSGLTDKKPEISDFVLSDNTLNKIVSVSDGVEVRDSNNLSIGKEFEIGITSSAFNQYNVKLKAGAVIDRCDNENELTDLGDFYAADFVSEEHWYVGKNDLQDITAVLYNNKEIKKSSSTIDGVDKDRLPDDKYTLVLYGTGEMKDYSIEEGTMAPWSEDGFQKLISNVVIGEGITSVGELAFNNMSNLSAVKFHEGLETIGEDAFSYSGLESVILPKSVKTVEMNAFFYNQNLEELVLNEGLETLGQTAFTGHAIKELTIPSTLIEIRGKTFAGNVENITLEKLTFAPNSQLYMINEQAFVNNKIKSLVIPASVEIIGDHSFAVPSYDYSALESLSFEENSKLIFVNHQAFDYNKLESLTLPDSLVEIRMGAFRGLRDGVTSIHIGPNMESLGSAFVAGTNIREFTVDAANTHFTVRDGILYSKDMTTLMRIPDAYYKSHSSYTVPSGVTALRDFALYGWYENHTSSTKFVLNLPSSMTDIKSESNLSNFVVSEINVDSSKYKSVDGVVYSKDMTTLYKVPTLYDATSFSVPDTVTEIADGAFFGNNLIKNVTIPSSVTKIGSDAFYTDTNYALQNIYLNMDDVEFNGYTFDIYTFDNASSTLGNRTIYVNNAGLKAKIEAQYSARLDKITVQE